jgi:hypothetical protein
MTLSRRDIIEIARAFYYTNNISPKLKDIASLPFSKKRVIELFQTWNNMLQSAKLPLNRYKRKEINCDNCRKKFTKQIKEMRKSLRHFCGNACNAQFYTTGRKHSEETKAKISASLKAHRIFISQS